MTTESLTGELLTPDAIGYDEARVVWNAMIDRRPALVVRAEGSGDVASAIGFARRRGLAIAVRGGGHNVAGLGTCEGGLLIDLSSMREVNVDPERRLVRVGGGALWRDVDRATQRHGLATPSGIISSTGVGGLTLGGGIGWLARRHGLTSDNLVEAEVVGADGIVRTASDHSHADLFWGIRGGGGNFGVVTSFTFRLHEVGPEVLFGPTVYARRDAHAVLRRYREFAHDAPRDCCVWVDLLTAPPLPFLPDEAHGTPALSVIQFWNGDVESGERVLAPLRCAAEPLGDGVRVRPYVEAQSLFDEAYAAGKRNYWTADNLDALTDDAIDVLLGAAEAFPTAMSDILVHQLGGAIDDPAPDATAYPHRGAAFAITPGARWNDAADDDGCVTWTRELQRRLRPHALGTGYANFIGEASGAEAEAYGRHVDRLREVKRRYDPENVFRVNQNVRP